MPPEDELLPSRRAISACSWAMRFCFQVWLAEPLDEDDVTPELDDTALPELEDTAPPELDGTTVPELEDIATEPDEDEPSVGSVEVPPEDELLPCR